MDEVEWCLHPDATTEYVRVPARWRKWRTGRAWKLAWHHEHGFFVKRCPDCPAVAMQFDAGMAVEIMLPPWLLRIRDREAS